MNVGTILHVGISYSNNSNSDSRSNSNSKLTAAGIKGIIGGSRLVLDRKIPSYNCIVTKSND